MSAVSASLDKSISLIEKSRNTLVWDVPVRVFHWLMVVSFADAWLTAESERWRMVHVTLGYTMAGLVAFRIVWGLIGSRHARFANFVKGPRAIWQYLRSMASTTPQHFTGHNPAGALAIVAMLLLAVGVTASGWAIFNDIGGKWLEETHEAAATVMLVIVGIHIAAVALSSWRHRENLIGAMVDGRKSAAPQDGIRHSGTILAALIFVTTIGFWWLQWQSAPSAGLATSATATTSATSGGAKHKLPKHGDD